MVLPQGSGPRHLVQHPGGHVFVVTEYSIEVAVAGLSPDSGDFRLGFVGPATAGGALPGDSAAEIALAADGRHAYVGVRGSNRISVLEVEAGGAALRPVADVPSGGNWPRHHWRPLAAVAHERPDVVTFPLDAAAAAPRRCGAPLRGARVRTSMGPTVAGSGAPAPQGAPQGRARDGSAGPNEQDATALVLRRASMPWVRRSAAGPLGQGTVSRVPGKGCGFSHDAYSRLRSKNK